MIKKRSYRDIPLPILNNNLTVNTCTPSSRSKSSEWEEWPILFGSGSCARKCKMKGVTVT